MRATIRSRWNRPRRSSTPPRSPLSDISTQAVKVWRYVPPKVGHAGRIAIIMTYIANRQILLLFQYRRE